MKSEAAKFWPHSEEQQKFIPDLISRFEKWSAGIKSLIVFLKAVATVELSFIAANTKLAKDLESTENGLDIHNQGPFQPWISFALQNKKEVQVGDSQVSNLVLKRLEKLRAEIKQRLGAYESDISAFAKSINKTRLATLEAINTHEARIHNQEQNTISSSTPKVKFDSWLQERFLTHTLTLSVNQENLYQRSMCDLFSEMRVFDSHIVEELKRIFEEFALIKNSHYASIQAQMSLNANSLVKVQPHAYFESFSKEKMLQSSEIWKNERRIEEFSRKPKHIEVKKVGLLYRPSKLGMGMLHPLIAVLTATGFLHLFPIASSKKKLIIIHFQKKDLDRIQETTKEDLDTLPEDGNAQPELSISMAQARTEVEAVPKKDCFFALSTRQRHSKTMFKGAYEAILKHEFKACSENDMIEWIALISQSLKSNFPDGPPTPLFKSSESIETAVESIVKKESAENLKDYKQATKTDIFAEREVSENDILHEDSDVV